MHRKANEPAKASEFGKKAFKTAKKIARDRMKHPIWVERMGVILGHNKEDDLAHEFYQRAFELEEAARPADPPRIAYRLVPLAKSHDRLVRTKEAFALLERALKIRLKQLPEDDLRIGETAELVARWQASLASAKN